MPCMDFHLYHAPIYLLSVYYYCFMCFIKTQNIFPIYFLVNYCFRRFCYRIIFKFIQSIIHRIGTPILMFISLTLRARKLSIPIYMKALNSFSVAMVRVFIPKAITYIDIMWQKCYQIWKLTNVK